MGLGRGPQARARLGVSSVFPLWDRETGLLAAEFVASGYEAYLTCVDTTQLAAVVAGPLFRERIPVDIGERVRRDDRFEYCDLIPQSRPTSPCTRVRLGVGQPGPRAPAN